MKRLPRLCARFLALLVPLLSLRATTPDPVSTVAPTPANLPSATASASAGFTGSNWLLLDSTAAVAAGDDITPVKFPNCDYAIVDAHEVSTYRADGTGEEQNEEFIKVLTERGRRAKRVLTRRFMVPYSTVEVVKIELLRAGGVGVAIDIAANQREAADSSAMTANIYDPNMRLLQVNIPGVEIGDVIHTVTRRTTTRAYIPGEFADESVFETDGFIRHITYDVISPADHPLRHRVLRDEIRGTITSSVTKNTDGTILYRWEINSVPRMYPEPGMPSPLSSLQRLFVSTLPDWPAVSRWYWNLSAPHLKATSPELKKSVADLVANAHSETEKLKAIFYYVSKNIRYMGLTPEKDRPGYEPHDVQLTYAKKYGVCRDKAALLVSMLRAAGFAAYPVLESYGWRKDVDAPDAEFNHAIVAVERAKGDYLLMDPTDENTLDFLPAQECNWSYLICRPEGEQIKVIPVQSAEKNLMTIQTAGDLDASGTLQARTAMSFAGINDNAYREALVRMKPDDRQRLFEMFLKQAVPGARLTALTIRPQNLLDRTQSLHVDASFTATGMTASGSGKSIVTLPWLGRHFGIVSFLLRSAGLEKRKYPIQTYVACGVHEEVTVKLSGEYTSAVSMPACTPEDDATTTYGEKVQLDHGKLVGARDLTLKVAEFSPSEYLALKQTLQNMAYDERKAPILATEGQPAAEAKAIAAALTTAVDSDTKTLEEMQTIVVQDAHAAVVTIHEVKKVLTYNGKKSAAEVKLFYNPACQSARIVHAKVTAADGKVQEISSDEMNVMDAPWNAAAKRYPGGKILVANLPGVEIGSTLDVEYEITAKNKPFISGFIPFQGRNESASHVLTVTHPSEVPLHSSARNPSGDLTATAKTEGGQEELTWSAKEVAPLPNERNLPPAWSFMTGVHYFAGDPAAYWHDLVTALTMHAGHATRAAELAHQLANGARGGTAAVTAIRDYVAKNIRAAGPSFTELPLAALSDADTTLTDGYGHAADRAILLYAMLDATGFRPEFLLASGIPPIEGLREIATTEPLPHVYETPLVRVTLEGQAYYLNDTDQYARLGTTNHDGFLALNPVTAKYETIHAAPDCGATANSKYAITFAGNGTARVTITRSYFGTGYNEKKHFFAELPPEERRRYFEQAISGVAQGARPVGPLLTHFDAYPGVETFTVDIDHYAVVDGKHFYFSVPFRPSLVPLESDQRALALFIPRAVSRSVTADITLPASYTDYVIAPSAKVWKAPAGAGKVEITTTNQPGHTVVNYHFEVAPTIVSARDCAELVSLEGAIGNRATQLFLIDQPGAAPDELATKRAAATP